MVFGNSAETRYFTSLQTLKSFFFLPPRKISGKFFLKKSLQTLLVLAGVQPAELRRRGATLIIANYCCLDPDRILSQIHGSQDASKKSLKSRRQFVPAAQNLLDRAYPRRTSARPSGRTQNGTWRTLRVCEQSLHSFSKSTSHLGTGLPRAF